MAVVDASGAPLSKITDGVQFWLSALAGDATVIGALLLQRRHRSTG